MKYKEDFIEEFYQQLEGKKNITQSVKKIIYILMKYSDEVIRGVAGQLLPGSEDSFHIAEEILRQREIEIAGRRLVQECEHRNLIWRHRKKTAEELTEEAAKDKLLDEYYATLPGHDSISEAREAMIKTLRMHRVPATDVQTFVKEWRGRLWLALKSYKTSTFDRYENMKEDMKWQAALPWSCVSFNPTTMSAAICLAGATE